MNKTVKIGSRWVADKNDYYHTMNASPHVTASANGKVLSFEALIECKHNRLDCYEVIVLNMHKENILVHEPNHNITFISYSNWLNQWFSLKAINHNQYWAKLNG